MIYNVYATYDKLADTYAFPFCINEKVAIRQFNFTAKEVSDAEAADKVIMLVGQWNGETGELLPMKAPKPVYDLEKSHKEMKENETQKTI